MSAADMQYLLEAGNAPHQPIPVKRKNGQSGGMIAGALTTAAVVLATSGDTLASDHPAARREAAEDAKEPPRSDGIPAEEVAALNQQSEVAEDGFQIAGIALGEIFDTRFQSGEIVSEAGMPDNAVTDFPGLSDPSQQTFAVDLMTTGDPAAAPSLQRPTGDLARGSDGANGLDGARGADGRDGSDGTDGADGNALVLVPRDPAILAAAARAQGLDDLAVLISGGQATDDAIAGLIASFGVSIAAKTDALLIVSANAEALAELLALFSASDTGAAGDGADQGPIALTGSDADDHLIGNDADNVISGHGGDDVLIGGRGADTLLGGDGTDTADYSASDGGVQLDLDLGAGSGGDAQGDRLTGIENLAGSRFDDHLFGDDGKNRLGSLNGDDEIFGRGGNDTLLGGNGGDLLDGGDGLDTADYTGSREAVHVDLSAGTASGGQASGDRLVSIEYLAGSAHADTLAGDEGVNRLTGRNGDDALFGHAGNDTLLGGRGDDVLSGGDGNDVFIIGAGEGNDIIMDFEAGPGRTDRLWLKDHGFEDFAAVQAAMTDTAEGVLLDLANGSVMFQGLEAAVIGADDFIL